MLKKMTLKTKYLFLFTALFIFSCTYSFRTFNKHNVDKIFIETFANQSDYMEAGFNLTNYITDYIRSNSIYIITGRDDSEAYLKGEIKTLDYKVYNFRLDEDDTGEAEDYKLYIQVQIGLYDSETDDPIWTDKSFKYDKTVGAEVIDDETRLNEEIDEFLKESSEMLLNELLGDW